MVKERAQHVMQTYNNSVTNRIKYWSIHFHYVATSFIKMRLRRHLVESLTSFYFITLYNTT